MRFFKKEEKKDVNSEEADLIYQTLQKNYPLEIKKIHAFQSEDMRNHGHITERTEKYMNELMEKVVADNKRLGRT